MKIAFIAWTKYHRRSELLAKHLGASSHYVYYGQTGHLSQAPVRYLVQAWRTWRLLCQERPDIIFVQNPPIFAVMVVSLYAWICGARYVIDSHTGAFVSSRWRWSVRLHRRLSSRALMTIVHNQSQESIVQNWGTPYLVVAFTPGEYPLGDTCPLSRKLNVAVICSFNGDEPLEILFEAAGQLTEVCFYLTGDSGRLDNHLLKKKPGNVFLTGYLSYERYVGLLRGVSAIMDLVDKDHTLLMGGFEAVSLGIPLIVSDWPLLRNYFCLGTVYIPNTVKGVCEGVRQMQHDHARLQREMLLLKERLEDEWTDKLLELQHLLNKD